MNPKLSIITICKNEGVKLKRTLESLINQTEKNFEFIVIDGGSTDSTLAILKEYSNITTHLRSEPDSGIYNAQNKGAALAQGTYLLFLNGGDYLADQNVIGTVFEHLYRGPSSFRNEMPNVINAPPDILYGDLWIEDNNGGKILGKAPTRIDIRTMIVGTIWHPASFIKREVFNKLGPYDETFKIVGDYDFFLKATCVHHVSTQYLPIAISNFVTNGISNDHRFATLHKAERLKSQLKYFTKFQIYKYLLIQNLIGLVPFKIRSWIKTKLAELF